MRREQGATLLVVLIMLVVLTLLGVAGMRMSTSSLQIVGNMQARKFTENIASQAIEDVMNSIAPFNSPTGTVTLRVQNPDGSDGTATAAAYTGAAPASTDFISLPTPSGVKVAVSKRVCQFSAPASGYSAVSTIAPEDNLWEFTVVVQDTFTNANSTMVQGTKIRQLAGSCS
jgi:Tfp pilus assembly protein PilX